MGKIRETQLQSPSDSSPTAEAENSIIQSDPKASRKRKSATIELEKKKKGIKTCEDENTEKVLSYLKAQNRPYSAQNIFDNLHAQIPKAILQKTLDQLSEENRVLCKEYGKFRVYLYEQRQLGEAKSPKEIEIMNSVLLAKRESAQDLEEQLKAVKLEIAKVEAANYRRNRIIQVKGEIKEGIDTIKRLELEHPDRCKWDVKDYKKKLEVHRVAHEEWNKKKKICMALISTVSQITESKIDATMVELAIERDEDS